MESDQQLRAALDSAGIPALNDMQETAIQAIQNEKDVILLAPTGSGKTLAFLLPVLSRLSMEKPGVQCLVLSPTRELAIQIERVWQSMSTGFKVNTCYGGHPMQIEVQNLSQPPALLIGTPGRILEHITRESFALDGVKILVLDEFDKSLSMGFQEQMTDIIKALPALEKRILVSATSKLNIPEFVGITHPRLLNYNRTAEKSTDGLRIKTVISTSGEKIDALCRLLCLIGEESALIFCNQRDSTERTKAQLDELGIRSACFHGGMEQLDRETTLIKFRNGSILFLVASDLAARGLDIPDVKHVIHFELPLKNNDFIHRNGRTARMYSDGVAYLILNPDEPLPAYLEIQPERFQLPEQRIPPPSSPWMTLYISGGKKDKLSKIDIVGFLSKKGNLQQDDIGKIELMDFMSFVAVKKNVVGPMLDRIQKEKMKGKKYKIGVAK